MARAARVLSIWLVSAPLGLAGQAPDRYAIDASLGSPAHFHVTARLHPSEGRLRMSAYGAWGQPDGWATFVSGLTASNCHGASLAVRKVGKLDWALAGWRQGDVCVGYDLDFATAGAEPWPDGPRTTGLFVDGSALFTNTGALFVFADSTRVGEVAFRLPPGSDVSTPWTAIDSSTFSAPVSALIRNTVVIGPHERAVQMVGPLRIQTVMLGAMRPALGLVAQAVAAIGDEYLAVYPEPAPRDLLFVWFSDGAWETGEAYAGGVAIASATIPDAGNRVIWANSIAHELQHHWLGHLTTAANWEDGNWFIEGFSEYLANAALVRSGLITEADYLSLVRKHLTLFHNFQFRWGTPYQRVSLVRAGSEKATNNVAVYDGGWFAALMFEVLMRRASGGNVGVDQLVATLVQRFAGSRFTNDDIVRVGEEISGADLREAYAQYVAGTRRMPLGQFLAWAGFDATVTPYAVEVRYDPAPADLALRIRRSITRGAR